MYHDTALFWPRELSDLLEILATKGLEPRTLHQAGDYHLCWGIWDLENECWLDV